MKPATSTSSSASDRMVWTVQPLSTAGILTDALRLMRSDFWRLCAIVAILVIPANVVVAMVIYLFMRHMGRIPHLDPDVALIGLAYYMALLMGTLMIWGMVMPFAQIALVRGITDRYLGQEVSIRRAYRWVAANFWMVAGTILLMSTILAAGFTLFIFPGLIAMFLLMLVVPVMVTEERGGFYALQRSVALVMANPGRIMVLVVVTWLLGLTISSLPQMLMPQPEMQNAPMNPDDVFDYYNATALTTAITTALAGLTQSVIRTLRGAVYLLAYFDGRCRADGFDIEFAARKAGVWGPAPLETAEEAGGG